MQELPTDYQKFIHTSRYARWVEEEKRRETWDETVNRYVDFMVSHLKNKHDYTPPPETVDAVRGGILSLKIMPSMRAMMTAGKALFRDNVCGYNCAYLPVDSLRSFDEALYILMCGTGVGFSVERQFVSQLPAVSEHFENSDSTIVVADSKAGWARAFKELISMLYSGQVPKWDLSRLRPAGAKLKTFGGRSSGPEPLNDLFNFTVETIRKASGRRLTSIECHDLMCKVGEVVVVGGVRRSALISLSNLSDDRMRNAKSGQWWDYAPHRSLANNSVCYTEKPDMEQFIQEWTALYRSKSGERGIFNRQGVKKIAAMNGRRDNNHEFGTNPCSEIILRPYQFCNLSEVVVREDDTVVDLEEKVRLAAILGTWQSTLTDFKYLRKVWRDNTEEERLLGVSLTGIMDNELLSDPNVAKLYVGSLKEVAVESNKNEAERIGIPQSTAVTCVKPSGTVSQLVDSASGIHPRYSNYYVRTVRGDIKDPLTQFMIDSGVPVEPCAMKPESTAVFSFPMKAPSTSVFRDDRTAVEQLELWKVYQEEWCEHKPSVTIYVKEHEWLEVGAWVYKNFDLVSGVSFLPHSDHSYQQAPYQEVSEEEYKKLLSNFPEEIDWGKLKEYEEDDTTSGSQELACTGGVCEVVDITGTLKE